MYMVSIFIVKYVFVMTAQPGMILIHTIAFFISNGNTSKCNPKTELARVVNFMNLCVSASGVASLLLVFIVAFTSRLQSPDFFPANS